MFGWKKTAPRNLLRTVGYKWEGGRGRERWADREGQKEGKETYNQKGLGNNPIKSADLS